MEKDRRLFTKIGIRNLLSFGPSTPEISLESLNILIGPNSSGKSNLIESFALIRSLPFDAEASNSNLPGIIRRGGGIQEWIWKGGENKKASLSLEVKAPSGTEFSYVVSFRNQGGFVFDGEFIEATEAAKGKDFSYKSNRGRVQMVTPPGRRSSIRRFDRELSILAQRRDEDHYPEISELATVFERIRIYRNWTMGPLSALRNPQSADLRFDRVEDDLSNVFVVLSRVRKNPRVRRAIVNGMRDLYSGFDDFEVISDGRTVQLYFIEGEFSFPAARLSDGSLRYLCLLTILCDPEPPPLLCLEEPELGLHPDILPKLADLLIDASRRTQLIVTTHSDILIDAMTERPECVVVCEKTDRKTAMRRLRKEELSSWLDSYRLGQLWLEGEIGGTRW